MTLADVQAEANLEDCLSLQVVREASRRVLGLRPFDVQLIGGMVRLDTVIRSVKI